MPQTKVREEDEVLMERFAEEEDEEAFRTLANRYRGPLINFMSRLVYDRDRAEDLAQEVLTRLFEHREQYRPGGKFRTYLYRIAHNLCVDGFRRAGRRPQELSLDVRAGGDDDGSSYAEMVADSYRTPQTAAHRGELMDEIQRAIGMLPPEQKMVFVLSESQGMKYADIATVLDIPVGTVKSRMHNSVGALKQMLSVVSDQDDQSNDPQSHNPQSHNPPGQQQANAAGLRRLGGAG
jgi:RNA polymerase sigma-70 factor (ECF subfamily)